MKICAIGLSSSIHVEKRTTCFLSFGHDVIVISQADHKIAGVKNIFVPQDWGRNKLKILSYVYRLYRVIRKERPDIVLMHYAQSYEIMACWLAGYPYVVTLMGSDILKKLDGGLNFLRKRMLVFGLKKASLLLSKSENITAVARRHLGADIDIENAIWGIDLSVFRPTNRTEARQKLNIDDGKTVVLSPRSPKPIYNVDLILKAAPFLKRQYDIKLLICSYAADPDYLAYLHRLVNELDLGREVVFLGSVSNEDMVGLYSASDVSVMVPDSDGLPISLLEAMACRVPNVVSNLPLYNEIVTDRVSAVYAERNAESIAAAIAEVASPGEFRQSLIDHAFQRVSQVGDFWKNVSLLEKRFADIAASVAK